MIDHGERVARLQQRLDITDVEALLVTDLVNVRYLTGFSGTAGQLFVTPSRAVFLTDPRYEARAGALVEAAEVQIYPSRLSERLRPLVDQSNVERLGFEAKTMTIDYRDDLGSRLPETSLVPTRGVVEEMRRVKDLGEIELLRAVIALGDRAFTWVLDRLEPGVTERSIAIDLEVQMRRWGAEEVSFPAIVGSGELSAHIHHTPTDRKLQKGDLVLLDFGCRKEGYCSDLTRTVVLGPATDEQHEIYQLVLHAQLAGIAAAGPGVPGISVDSSARAVIEDAGRGEQFGHGLGHGVGLEVHEAPRLNRISEDTLVPGDVVTVEPGVYVRGSGGVRIEDCVAITETGCEVLGTAPKDELIEL